MWALPDIRALNSGAKTQSAKRKIAEALRHPETIACEHCEGPSDYTRAWYDVFSDDPKGVLGICDGCLDEHGSTPEGYFECEACERLFIENYTWENYSHYEENLGQLCLNCWRVKYLAEDEHWIALPEGIDQVTFEQVRQSPHLLAHAMDTPKDLTEIGGVSFDSMSGTKCYGGDGMEDLRALLKQAHEAGHRKAVLILDGAYQFAVSIGVYAPKRVRSQKRPRGA